MKLILAVFGLASLLPAAAFAAGSEAIIKQRAKELSNQNNVRQGVAPPAAAAPAASGAAARPTLTPQQQALARIQSDLAAIKSPVTQEQRQRLTADLMALAQGPHKPSYSRVSKLAEEMAAALAQKALSEGTRSRLVQDLNAAFNPSTLPATQLADINSDVQAVFQSNGASRKDAVAIADELKGITSELQKAAGK